MLTIFNRHNNDDGDESLFARVQAIAKRLSQARVAEARTMRDAAYEAASEDTLAKLSALPEKFDRLSVRPLVVMLFACGLASSVGVASKQWLR